MSFRIVTVAAIFLFAGIVAGAQVHAQDTTAPRWPTTEFEVSTQKPGLFDEAGNELYNFYSFLKVDITDAQREAIAQAMHEIAEYLQAQGFRPPNLDQTWSGDKYMIHVVDIDRERGGAYYRDCLLNILPSEIMIEFKPHGRRMFDGTETKLSRHTYSILAHELFHAVQRNYSSFDDFGCTWGGWIFEGTAKAVGDHVAEVMTGQAPPPDDFQNHLYARPYDFELRHVREFELFRSTADHIEYDTASFWMWLAEQYKTKDRLPPIENPGAKGRDFSYIHKFLETDASDEADSLFFDDPTEAEIMTWLDVSLRFHFRTTLPRAYADFVTSYAAYVPGRSKSEIIDGESWRKQVLGGCPQLELSEAEPIGYTTLDFKAIASRCVEIGLDTRDKVQLVIVGRGLGPSPARKALAGMSVGVPGTSQIRQADLFELGGPDQPNALPPNQSGSFAGHDVMASWTVCFDPQVDEAIVIANVSGVGSEQLHKGEVEFAIMHADWYASLTNVGPQLSEAELVLDCDGKLKKTFAATAEQGAATDAEKAYDKVKSDLAGVSTHTMSAASVGRSPNEHPCGQPFQWIACGPMTRVSLRLAPGTFGDLAATSGRGGLLAQMTGMLQASGQAVLDGSYQAWLERVTEIPGHEIRLHFPLIDYGFTGTFNNAYITAQMPGRKALESIGPTDAIPGPGTRFPLNGTVTVTEYSPEIMRGSFSGTMVYGEDHDPSSPNQQQTLPVRHELKGDFVVAAPILNDRRIRRLDPHEYQDFRADLELIFPGLQGLLENGAPAGAVSLASDPAAGLSASASTGRRCDCSCNYSDTASSVCSTWCEPVYKACEGTPAKVRSNPDAMSPAAEKQAIEDLRDAVRKRTIERFGENAVDQIMVQFDAMPETLQAKRFWSYVRFPELKP